VTLADDELEKFEALTPDEMQEQLFQRHPVALTHATPTLGQLVEKQLAEERRHANRFPSVDQDDAPDEDDLTNG
jgi:hypothetical protein